MSIEKAKENTELPEYIVTRSRSERKRLRSSCSVLSQHSLSYENSTVSDPSFKKALNGLKKKQPDELFVEKGTVAVVDSPLDSENYWPVGDEHELVWTRGVQWQVHDESGNFFVSKSRLNPKLTCYNFLHTEDRAVKNVKSLSRYTVDELDLSFLKWLLGTHNASISVDEFECMIVKLEDYILKLMYEKLGAAYKHDEEVFCDICREGYVESDNQILFCDICDVCVHQTCYGIITVPDGPWLCRPCSVKVKPKCELCPNAGGAFKAFESGSRWCHVSCALYVPEIKVGSFSIMEPILELSSIPPLRWNLICYICHIKEGVCIQCSVPLCRRAFHVTCGLNHKLYLKADKNSEHIRRNKLNVFISGNSEVIHWDEKSLLAYCAYHNDFAPKAAVLNNDGDDRTAYSTYLKEQKLKLIKSLDINRVTREVGLEHKFKICIQYWQSKKADNQCKPLIDKDTVPSIFVKNIDQDLRIKTKVLVSVRQDLERVRNLCYLIYKREKLGVEHNDLCFKIFIHKDFKIGSLAPFLLSKSTRLREDIRLFVSNLSRRIDRKTLPSTHPRKSTRNKSNSRERNRLRFDSDCISKNRVRYSGTSRDCESFNVCDAALPDICSEYSCPTSEIDNDSIRSRDSLPNSNANRNASSTSQDRVCEDKVTCSHSKRNVRNVSYEFEHARRRKLSEAESENETEQYSNLLRAEYSRLQQAQEPSHNTLYFENGSF